MLQACFSIQKMFPCPSEDLELFGVLKGTKDSFENSGFIHLIHPYEISTLSKHTILKLLSKAKFYYCITITNKQVFPFLSCPILTPKASFRVKDVEVPKAFLSTPVVSHTLANANPYNVVFVQIRKRRFFLKTHYFPL